MDRIQRRRCRGWRMPPDATYVGRPTRWGNPFPVGEHGAAEACRLFEQHLLERPGLVAAGRRELAGRRLACWCRLDQPCHADVWLRLVSGSAGRSLPAGEITTGSGNGLEIPAEPATF